ncbi:hypothetical protein B0H13DRAFT_1889485 [Mycena leptocephala]|nr:hypothetical protein B0H13DRAFT_1889485 [Mycena leptocephala]
MGKTSGRTLWPVKKKIIVRRMSRILSHRKESWILYQYFEMRVGVGIEKKAGCQWEIEVERGAFGARLRGDPSAEEENETKASGHADRMIRRESRPRRSTLQQRGYLEDIVRCALRQHRTASNLDKYYEYLQDRPGRFHGERLGKLRWRKKLERRGRMHDVAMQPPTHQVGRPDDPVFCSLLPLIAVFKNARTLNLPLDPWVETRGH